MFSKGKIKESDSTTTIISKNTSFVGDISSGEKIIIHGKINGNIDNSLEKLEEMNKEINEFLMEKATRE